MLRSYTNAFKYNLKDKLDITYVNNGFIKNHQQILLDFAAFAWLEQPEGNLMNALSRVCYNGSYTIAAKPINTLELHYTLHDPFFNNRQYYSVGSNLTGNTIF